MGESCQQSAIPSVLSFFHVGEKTGDERPRAAGSRDDARNTRDARVFPRSDGGAGVFVCRIHVYVRAVFVIDRMAHASFQPQD